MGDRPLGIDRKVIGARNLPELGKCVLVLECKHEVVVDHKRTPGFAWAKIVSCPACAREHQRG